MHMLQHELLWVSGVCYRQYPQTVLERSPEDFVDIDITRGSYSDEPINCAAFDENEESLRTTQASATNGFYRRDLSVPPQFLGRICGERHLLRKQIEHETKTEIKIPAPGSSNDIVITGKDHEGVQSAIERIESIVDTARQRTSFTHFISIPLSQPAIKKSLKEFKEIVYKTCPSDDICDELFVHEKKLHLTICVLVLLTEKEIKQARKILKSCCDIVDEVLKGDQLTIKVGNLEHMSDDPTAVDVLYAKIFDYDGKLQEMCDKISTRFRDSKLALRPLYSKNTGTESVKLHMTVMNTRFRTDRLAATNPIAVTQPVNTTTRWGRNSAALTVNRNTQRTAFNATRILSRYRDYCFGKVYLREIHLSDIRGMNTNDGYYQMVERLNLPSRKMDKEDEHK